MNPLLTALEETEINRSQLARELGVNSSAFANLRHVPSSLGPEKRRKLLKLVARMARDFRRFDFAEPEDLREVVKKHGLRLAYLANRLGVSRNAAWLWGYVPAAPERRTEIEREIRRVGEILEAALESSKAH